MVQRHLMEQIELLREHMELGNPSPEFIERHAYTIMELAKELPFNPPKPSVYVFRGLEAASSRN